MFIALNVYLKRITDALENVVAPEIDSDHVRGQLYATIDLIRQLNDRIEYKQDLINNDIETNKQLIVCITAAMQKAGVAAPDDLRSFMKSLDEGTAGKGVNLRNKMDEMLSVAIDLFHTNKEKLGAEAAEIDRAIRDTILKIVGRDIGLMKPPMIEKISRSKKPEKRP